MTLLLTSFDTWLPHHKSNSSDDLLEKIELENRYSCYYLRKLPVDTEKASKKAIAVIEEVQPSAIVCCGMAESRYELTIESNARCNLDCIQTKVNLLALISYLAHTSISDDAGRFVCEGLYYNILKYLQNSSLKIPCIFVHVPKLTTENKQIIYKEFNLILDLILNNKLNNQYQKK